MSIPRSVSKNSGVTPYGIVRGNETKSLGTVKLDVVFVKTGNFAKDKLEFEVLDWQSQYHAILGRPTFAQFMEVPHYAYLMLKMLGPAGVITVNGSFLESCHIPTITLLLI